METSMARKDEKTCPQCNGTGQIQIKKDVYVRCSMCNGSGTVSA
jgi:DnaJ-class molecular chaperone